MSGPEYGVRSIVNCPNCGVDMVYAGDFGKGSGHWVCPNCDYMGGKPPADPAPSPLRDSLDDIAGAIVEMLVRKNTDYGDSYRRLRDEFGPDSFLIRLGDKYNRLIALRGKEALVSETTDDTIKDIVGYCFLEMAYRRGEAE